MLSFKQSIINEFKSNGNERLTPAQLKKRIPGRDHIYTPLSEMVLKSKVLERDDKNGYRLSKQYCVNNNLPYEPVAPMPDVKVSQVAEGVHGKKAPIIWSPEERAALAAETHRVILSAPHGINTAFGIAQVRVLMQHRRFDPPWEAIKVWLYPMLDAIKASHASTLPPSADVLLAGLLERARDFISESIIEVLKSDEVRALLAPQSQATQWGMPYAPATIVPRHNPEPAPTEKKELERILIVGLDKPHQQVEVLREFKDKLDIRFSPSDINPARLRSSASGCKVSLMMTNIVKASSRNPIDILKSDNFPVELIHGNIGKLKERLTELSKLSTH